MASIDPNRQYLQSDLPSDVFNQSNGGVTNFGGQQVKVTVNSNGTRSLSPISGSTTSSSATPTSGIPSADDVLNTAKKLNEFQVQQNQPAISTLKASVDPLKQKYSDLLASIKGDQQTSLDKQTLATNNELGQRGILPGSGFYQQEQVNAAAPINRSYAGLTAQTGISQLQDEQTVQNAIAQLQAGNAPASIQSAQGLLGAQQQASQFAQTLPIQQQAGNTAARYITIPGVGVYDTQAGKVINSLSGGGSIQMVNGIPMVNIP